MDHEKQSQYLDKVANLFLSLFHRKQFVFSLYLSGESIGRDPSV